MVKTDIFVGYDELNTRITPFGDRVDEEGQ
jgi:hypothetical protein